MARTLLYAILIVLLAACQPPAAPTPTSVGIIGEVTRPELVDAIQWDRSPNTVVFRAEVAGGDMETAFYARNDVPYCTIYGDNRVVWTTTTIRSDDGVVFDLVSDEAIRIFVDWLINEKRIYDYKTGVDLLVPTEARPVFERLTLYVNDQIHQTDSFGGWDFAFFQEVMEACRSISTTPIAFEPEGAWVSAQEIDYNPDRSSILWDGSAAGLKFAELASSGERRWLTGQNVKVLWDRLRSGGADLQFTDESATYLVAVEVPNITRSSPPAP
jgi:hypothetical protein